MGNLDKTINSPCCFKKQKLVVSGNGQQLADLDVTLTVE